MQKFGETIEIRCPCKKKTCPRYGKCGECLLYHRQHKRFPPYCKRRGRSPKTIFETPRLLLRELEQSDFADLCSLLQDQDVMYAYEHAFDTQEVVQWLQTQLQRYKKDGFGLWAVILKQTGMFIGQAGITIQELPTGYEPEIGYLLKKEYWHCGYATEAARGCMEYAFSVLALDRICCIIRDNNLPSQRVAMRCGMVQKGRFIKHYYGMDMPHLIFGTKKDVCF